MDNGSIPTTISGLLYVGPSAPLRLYISPRYSYSRTNVTSTVTIEVPSFPLESLLLTAGDVGATAAPIPWPDRWPAFLIADNHKSTKGSNNTQVPRALRDLRALVLICAYFFSGT